MGRSVGQYLQEILNYVPRAIKSFPCPLLPDLEYATFPVLLANKGLRAQSLLGGFHVFYIPADGYV